MSTMAPWVLLMQLPLLLPGAPGSQSGHQISAMSFYPRDQGAGYAKRIYADDLNSYEPCGACVNTYDQDSCARCWASFSTDVPYIKRSGLTEALVDQDFHRKVMARRLSALLASDLLLPQPDDDEVSVAKRINPNCNCCFNSPPTYDNSHCCKQCIGG